MIPAVADAGVKGCTHPKGGAMEMKSETGREENLPLIRLALCLLVGSWSVLPAPAPAAPAVEHINIFAICDGQAGVALGLCHGAVMLECDGLNAGTDKCLALEERFKNLTGLQDVPWVYRTYPSHVFTTNRYSFLDLETGVDCMDDNGILHPACPGDVWTAFDGSEPPEYLNPWRLLAGTICDAAGTVFAEFAFLDGVPMDNVSPEDIDNATFGHGPNDDNFMPVFDFDDTAIVRTCSGNFFKIGYFTCYEPESPWTQCNNYSLPSNSMQFVYRLLRAAP